MIVSVSRRIKELDKRTVDISMYDRGTDEFLAEKVQIRPHPVFPGFHLDNITLYEEALNDVIELTGTLYNVNKIISYIYEKFGMYGTSSGIAILLQGRERVNGKCVGVSIDNFVGKGVALSCVKASFLHNCLKLLGYDAILVFGYIKKGDLQEEPLAYNLVSFSDKYYLVDCCNYTCDGDKVIPNIFELTQEKFEELIYGEGGYESKSEDYCSVTTLDKVYKYSWIKVKAWINFCF